jgi:hypothetical protein
VIYWTQSSRTQFGVSIMSGDWRVTLWTLLVTFFIVIIRCIETFWSPCIILSTVYSPAKSTISGCAVGPVVPHILKDCSAFIFTAKESKKNVVCC